MVINHVGLPDNLNLPFFAYGIFKPGQIAYKQIKRFCWGEPIRKIVKYEMKYRDGVPLLEGEKNPNFSTKGFLISFDNPQKAYDKIGKSEPNELYEWAIIDADGTDANALVGKDTGLGCCDNREEAISDYDYRLDSFFNEAHTLIKRCVDDYNGVEEIDMEDFFHIQMHYMLLWSVIERFCSFKYGYFSIGPNQLKLASEPIFENNLKNVAREDEIYSSDKLIKK